MSLLGDRLLEVHAAFDAARLPHAFGGAIALAYCAQEPRGTRDIDVNVYVGLDRVGEALDALPAAVTVEETHRAQARRDGQVRVWWEETPIDLFFETHSFHRETAKDVTVVPFEGKEIPVLGCEALIVFKAMFNRTKDWADIEEIVGGGGATGREALAWLRSLMGPSDPVVVRLEGLLA